MPTGSIQTFNAFRGFGFISPDDGGPDIFVHVRKAQEAGIGAISVGRSARIRDRDGCANRTAACGIAEVVGRRGGATMTMHLTANESAAIAAFRDDPAAQAELRPFMKLQGTCFGRGFLEMISTLPVTALLSNSGRCEVAEAIGRDILKHADTLRALGHDEIGIEIFVDAAKAEVDCFGISI